MSGGDKSGAAGSKGGRPAATARSLGQLQSMLGHSPRPGHTSSNMSSAADSAPLPSSVHAGRMDQSGVRVLIGVKRTLTVSPS